MTKKLPFRVVHHGRVLRISGDYSRMNARRHGSRAYDAGLTWRDGGTSYGYSLMYSWNWRDLQMRAHGRNWQSVSGKKDKKFWRKVHRHIEKHAS